MTRELEGQSVVLKTTEKVINLLTSTLMNTIFLTLFFMCCTSSLLFSQEFDVRSFSKDPNDISGIRFPRKDVNNQSAAVIKVRTNLQGLNYNCNSGFIGDPVEKDGDIWLYVSPRERRIKFMKDGFLPLDYQIQLVVEPSSVYILELVNKFRAPGKPGASLGFILIKSEPSGAMITLNGEETGMPTPFQKALHAGQHRFSLQQSLYKPYTGNFMIQPGETETLNIELIPDFGHLRVTSEPESGAEIIIDGKSTGKTTPATIEQLSTGSQEVLVQLNQYESFTQAINVANGETTSVKAVLTPTFGEVTIDVPDDATICIDKVKVSVGPYSGRLFKGEHLVEVKHDCYHDFAEQLQVEIGQTYNISPSLIHKTGMISIMTVPPEFDIYLDENFLGQTPKIIQGINIGYHTLNLYKEKYMSIRHDIDIEENQILEIIDTLPAYKHYERDDTSKYGIPCHDMHFKDPRDEQVYPTVQIGNQCWLQKNMNYKTINSWCYDNDSANCSIYGRLYSVSYDTFIQETSDSNFIQSDIQEICPPGWHVPSEIEWTILINYLGGMEKALRKMKSTSGWYNNKNGSNSSGFTALPSGVRSFKRYHGLTEHTFLWSSTIGKHSTPIYVLLDLEEIFMSQISPENGVSIRCIKD